MAQQINLCSPILLKQKRYFSAQTMAVALGVFVVLGGIMGEIWVWSLNHTAESYKSTIDSQANEIHSLQAAIEQGRAASGPINADQAQQLQARKTMLADRQAIDRALRDGVNQPGMAHSDRLHLIAKTIPPQAWITLVSATSSRFEVSGFTMEPDTLNEWVKRLAASPLFDNLSLHDVNVELAERPASTALKQTGQGSSNGSGNVRAGMQVWKFHLIDTQLPVAAALVSGGKP